MKNLIKDKLNYFVYFDRDCYLNFIYEIIMYFCQTKQEFIAYIQANRNIYQGLYNFFIN